MPHPVLKVYLGSPGSPLVEVVEAGCGG
jgi:hypothetical protein